jgi:glucose/arabinose dehydrogenase
VKPKPNADRRKDTLMRHLLSLLFFLTLAAGTPAAELPKPLVTGLKNPESVAVGPDGRIYVSVIGEFDKDGDGSIVVIKDGKAVPFCEGLDDPKGIVFFQQFLYVADKKRVLRIDKDGKAAPFAPEIAFPTPPLFLNDLAVDAESGTLYVSDSGDLKGGKGAVYRIDPKGTVSLVIDAKRLPALNTPNGLAMDGASNLLLLDFGSGELHRIKLSDGSSQKIADKLGSGDGLVWDNFGRLFTTDYKGGKVYGIPRPGEKPVLIAEGFGAAADCCMDAFGKNLLVPDMKNGTVTAIPATIPGWEVDTTPLPLESAVAFPDLKWSGWKGEVSGKIIPLRPLVLTHANDASNRVFVATQHGVIHVFPSDQKAKETKVFLDIQDRVYYNDNQNEEGFLGLAFPPNYKKTGEFFVFYTPKKRTGLINYLSRFRVSKDDPDKADPASEEILMKFEKPFWNHDGGTITFGPDGYLYIAHGDGGAANDPFDNGQSLKTNLGKILRIDISKKGDTKRPYGIPADNPFVDNKDAQPEIWAYGLRNVWRMSFDRKGGQLWAADVGQNLYEEINLIEKGGNFGWNRREGLHPFGARGMDVNKSMIEPIWEYHHDVGKSITGGNVYRGDRVKELEGHYIYGDYVTAKIWALKYDAEKKRVVANRPIKDRGLPLLSFGEDEKGDIYYMTYTPTGQGIYRFVPTAK